MNMLGSSINKTNNSHNESMSDMFSQPSTSNNLSQRYLNNQKIILRQTTILQEGRKDYQAKMEELQKQDDIVTQKLQELKLNSTISLSPDDASRSKVVDDDKISTLLHNAQILKVENEQLRIKYETSQKTVEALQKQCESYLDELKYYKRRNEFKNEIGVLENTIEKYREELEKQDKLLQSLKEEKCELTTQIQKLNCMLEDSEREKSTQQSKVQSLQQQNKKSEENAEALKIRVLELQSLVEDRMIRETNALSKVEEALSMTEVAIRERDEAMKREITLKEECNSLAATIGEVMEEAAHQVDNDIAKMHETFNNKEKRLTESIEKLRDEIENQNRYMDIMKTRSDRYEQKYVDSVAEIERLKAELEANKNTLTDLEKKLQRSVEKLYRERRNLNQSEELEEQVNKYLVTINSQKNKYNEIIDDLSLQFQEEVNNLRDENLRLMAEIKCLKQNSTRTESDHNS